MTPTLTTFNLTEAARELRISRNHLHTLIRKGELRTTRVGRRPRLRLRELERFLERNTQGGGA